jgi:Ca2+-binding EF-hand superfamily protein
VPAELIQLKRSTKFIEIKDKENGKTLEDLNFKTGETIIASKKSSENNDRIPLTLKGGQLTQEARNVFEDWFKTYSKDGLMRKEDACVFIKSCCEGECNINDSRIKDLFSYDHDNDGALIQDEFVEFYRCCSVMKTETVWKNIFQQNYTNELKKITDLSN